MQYVEHRAFAVMRARQMLLKEMNAVCACTCSSFMYKCPTVNTMILKETKQKLSQKLNVGFFFSEGIINKAVKGTECKKSKTKKTD